MTHLNSHIDKSLWHDYRHVSVHSRRHIGFTLVELLVTISIIIILIGLLLPGLSKIRQRARNFECQMNLRSVAFDFQLFTNPVLHTNRGDATGSNTFLLETYQESQYKIDEFWDRPGTRFVGDVSNVAPMNCPEVKGEIKISANTSCRSGAVQPRRMVSYAFNLRLERPDIKKGDLWIIPTVKLSDKILTAPPLVPLLWDIDGYEAEKRDINPHYSAPPRDHESKDAPYDNGNQWFPSYRHQGLLQVAFVSGEVKSSKIPLDENTWRWNYVP